MKLQNNQVHEYKERGYLFFPSLFLAEEVAVLRRAVAGLMSRTGPEVVREEADKQTIKMVFGAHFFNETFRRLSRHSRLLIPAEHLLHSQVHVFQSRLNPKLGFTGSGWCWHQDFNQWYRQDGMQQPRTLVVAVFLDPINAYNAPLMVIPGSHQHGHFKNMGGMEIDNATIQELVDQHGIEPLMGPAGTVVFFHCLLVHGSGPNASPWPRRIFYLNYNSVENRAIQQWRDGYHCSTDFTPLEPLSGNCLDGLRAGRESEAY